MDSLVLRAAKTKASFCALFFLSLLSHVKLVKAKKNAPTVLIVSLGLYVTGRVGRGGDAKAAVVINTAGGGLTGRPARPPRPCQGRGATSCTAVLSSSAPSPPSSSCSSSSAFVGQHWVWIANVHMFFLFFFFTHWSGELRHALFQNFDAGEHRFAGLPQRADEARIVERSNLAPFAIPRPLVLLYSTRRSGMLRLLLAR